MEFLAADGTLAIVTATSVAAAETVVLSVLVYNALLGCNNYLTERLVTFAVCLNVLIILKCGMDNTSLVGIHGLKRNRLVCLLNPDSDILCKILKCILTSCTIILCIKLNLDVRTRSLVNNKAYKVLEAIKCLTALSDEHCHVFTVDLNGKLASVFTQGCRNTCIDAHATEDLAYKLTGSLLR